MLLRLVRIGPAKRWGPGVHQDAEDASSCEDVACTSELENDTELVQYLQSNTTFLLTMSSTSGLTDASATFGNSFFKPIANPATCYIMLMLRIPVLKLKVG